MHEINRIKDIYSRRDFAGKQSMYSWFELNAEYQTVIKRRMIISALKYALSNDLSDKKILDVGCGRGVFLRMLLEWGAKPYNLVGSEFLEDRLHTAKIISPEEIHWHLGDLSFNDSSTFDVVSAQTVFSSILDDGERESLAQDMWAKLKPGGWLLVFDFRYNNPSNSHVRKVSLADLLKWWPSHKYYYETGMLAPPISRKIIRKNYLLPELLTTFFPFLRSHFIYMVQK